MPDAAVIVLGSIRVGEVDVLLIIDWARGCACPQLGLGSVASAPEVLGIETSDPIPALGLRLGVASPFMDWDMWESLLSVPCRAAVDADEDPTDPDAPLLADSSLEAPASAPAAASLAAPEAAVPAVTFAALPRLPVLIPIEGVLVFSGPRP